MSESTKTTDADRCRENLSNDRKQRRRERDLEYRRKRRQNETEEEREKRRKKNRDYMRKQRQNETEEERKKRLLDKKTYYDNMSDDKYYELLHKRRQKRLDETEDERRIRLYNRKLIHNRFISQLSDVELQRRKAEDKERKATWRQNASKEEKQRRKEKNSESKRLRRLYYEREASKRKQRRIHFNTAKHYKLLPAHSDLTTDTGHEPFVTYLIKNNLMYYHDPMVYVLREMMVKVRMRDFKRRWGKMINHKYVYNEQIYFEKCKDGNVEPMFM